MCFEYGYSDLEQIFYQNQHQLGKFGGKPSPTNRKTFPKIIKHFENACFRLVVCRSCEHARLLGRTNAGSAIFSFLSETEHGFDQIPRIPFSASNLNSCAPGDYRAVRRSVHHFLSLHRPECHFLMAVGRRSSPH